MTNFTRKFLREFAEDNKNTNFTTYQAHIASINNLTLVEDVESYNFQTGYLVNQTYNLT